MTNGSVTDCHHKGENEYEALDIYHLVNFAVVSLLSICGLCSQAVVLKVQSSIKKKTSTDVFLIGLAVFDAVLLIAINLSESTYVYSLFLHSELQLANARYVSAFFGPIEHIAHFANTWCTALMSIDRYVVVCSSSIKSRVWGTPKRAALHLIAIAVAATLFSLPRFFEYYPVFLGDNELQKSTCISGANHHITKGTVGGNIFYIWAYTFAFYITSMYILPLSILTFTSYHLIQVVRGRKKYDQKQRKTQVTGKTAEQYVEETTRSKLPNHLDISSQLDASSHNGSSVELAINEKRQTKSELSISKVKQYDNVVKTLVVVTVIFSLCQIPDMITQLLIRLYPSYTIVTEVEIVSNDFIIINCSINLLIYTAVSRRFKTHLNIVLSKLKKKNKVFPFPTPTTAENSFSRLTN